MERRNLNICKPKFLKSNTYQSNIYEPFGTQRPSDPDKPNFYTIMRLYNRDH